MPDARLQRTRAAYPEWNPGAWLAEMTREYDAQWCRICGAHVSAHAPECGQRPPADRRVSATVLNG